MSRKKGKNRKKYPIQLRLLAVLMAVVMVVSVITITNKRDKVKAGGGIISASMTDTKNALGGKVSGTFTIYVPVNGFKFQLDSSGEVAEAVQKTEAFRISYPFARPASITRSTKRMSAGSIRSKGT